MEGEDIVVEIRNRYPGLVLMGGVDANDLLVRGTTAQVENEIKRLINTVAPDIGYFIGSSIEMHPGCRPENLITMVETVRKYGEY